MVNSSVFYVAAGIAGLIVILQYLLIARMKEYMDFQFSNIHDFMECQLTLNKAFNKDEQLSKDCNKKMLTVLDRLNKDVYGEDGVLKKMEYCYDRNAVLERKISEVYAQTPAAGLEKFESDLQELQNRVDLICDMYLDRSTVKDSADSY